MHFFATLALRSISLPTRMDSPSKSFWPTFQTLFRCQAGDHYFGWFHAVIQVVFILLAAQDDVEVLSQTEVLLCIEQAVKVDMLKGVMDAFALTEVRQQTKYATQIFCAQSNIVNKSWTILFKLRDDAIVNQISFFETQHGPGCIFGR